jgi:hypothetical protein
MDLAVAQLIVTLVLCAPAVFLWVTSKPVPPELVDLVKIALAFWLGGISQAGIQRITRRR